MLLKLLLDTTKQGEIPWSQVKLLKGLAQMVFMGYNNIEALDMLAIFLNMGEVLD